MFKNWIAKLQAASFAAKSSTVNAQKLPGAVPNLSTDIRRIPNGESKVALALSTLSHFKIDRDAVIAGIDLVHNAGTIGGGTTGTYAANTIFNEIFLGLDTTMPLVDLKKGRNGVTGASSLLFTLQKILAGHANFPNECWELPCIPWLPPREGAPNVQLDLQVGAITDIESAGGDRTTYTGAEAYVQLHSATREAWKALGKQLMPGYLTQIIERNSNSFGATTGWVEFDLPTGVVYDANGFIMHVQDNGTLTDELFDEIKVKRGQDVIYEGHERFLKLFTQKESWQALTGYYWVKFDAPVNAHAIDSMKVELEIPIAGTDIIVTPITFTQIRPKA